MRPAGPPPDRLQGPLRIRGAPRRLPLAAPLGGQCIANVRKQWGTRSSSGKASTSTSTRRSGYSIGQGRGQRDVMFNFCVGSSPRRIRRSLRRKPLGEYGTKTDGCIRGATDFLQPISFQQEPSPSTRWTRFYTVTSRRLIRAPRQPGSDDRGAALPHQRPLGWRARHAPPTSVSLGRPNSSGRLTGPARYRVHAVPSPRCISLDSCSDSAWISRITRIQVPGGALPHLGCKRRRGQWDTVVHRFHGSKASPC